VVKQKVYCGHDIPGADCTEHWPLMCEVTGYTIERRAIEWALGNDTGTSSQTLCAFMLGINATNGCRGNGASYPPSDADDRSRCIRLLKLIPEWLPRLPELAEANPGGNWNPEQPNTPVKSSWEYQIPLILKEGGF
jgi:hypothetical protein